MQPEFLQVPLGKLRLSATLSQIERREHLDKGAIAELADSITTVGILQPLVVRHAKLVNPGGEDGLFEIVAGERRFQAAKLAKLATVPVSVRDLTDEQVLEVQLVENLQRADVHPMAEAEGYEGLRRIGRTADEIADKVGKSKAYVYARMKLLELVPLARRAYYAGKLNASTALYIARIPSSLQDKATKEITQPRWGGEPMSARQASEHLHQNYMLKLSDAGFKTEDTNLVPAAGPCGACPKRTGNQPQLFGDVKSGDVCTDPACFKQKIAAHAERAIAAAAETGQKVLAGKDAEKVAKNGTDDYDLERAGFVRLGARDYSVGNKTYRQVLGKDYVPTLLQDPETGKLMEIAPAADVDKARGNKKASGISRESQRQIAERRAGEQKHKAAIAYRVALFTAIFQASAKTKALVREDYNQIADRLFDRLDHDSKKRLFKAIGWEAKKSGHHGGVDLNPPIPIEKMQLEQLLQFIRACSLAHELQVWQHSGETKPKDLEAAAEMLGVDAGKIRRELDAAGKVKQQAKKKVTAKKGKK